MARQANQTMRFNDIELSLMKSLFANNDDLLFTVRKFLFQFPLTDLERESLKKAINPSVVALLKKIFMPDLDPDAPLFQLTDLKLGLNMEMKANKTAEEMYIQMDAKQVEVDYLEQQFKILENLDAAQEVQITIAGLGEFRGKEKEKAYIDLIARNYLLSFIDSSLQQVKFLAGKSDETVEETLKRLQKDSAR